MLRVNLAVILFFMLLQSSIVFAQQTKIVIRNTPNESIGIELKWYSQQLIYGQGVNIFRKEADSSDWQKINTFPIKGFQEPSSEAIAADSTLLPFTAMAKEIRKPDANGLLLLNVILKSFISRDYANYLGIYYLDETVELGKQYQYKIVETGKDISLVESEKIIAGKYMAEREVDNLKIDAGEKVAKLKWQLEEERFYATNIYRKKSGETIWIKVNAKPVLISEAPNVEGKQAAPKYLFVDDSLQEGATYSYKIAGVDFFGAETEMSDIVSVIIEDLTPPNPPETLKKDSVRKLNTYLSWHPAKEESGKEYVGYKVYRSNKSEGEFVLVSNNVIPKTDTQYIDIVNMPNPYYYHVVAVDEAGNEAKSNVVFVEVADVFPPKAPQNVIANADTGKIIISWNKNIEPDVKGYLLYRTSLQDDSRNFVLLNAYPQRDTFFVDVLPKRARSKFLYKVLAIDSSYNKSEYSATVGIRMPDIIAPEQPVIKSIKLDSNGVWVAWVANVELDLMHYELFRKVKGDTVLQKLSTISKWDKTYFDPTVKNNITYQYALVAVDSANNASEISPLFAIRYINDKQEGKEVNKLKAKYSKANKQVKLKWQEQNEADYLGTVIFRKDTTGVLKPLTGMLKNTMEYVDKGVSNKQMYWYEQRAYFKDGTIIKSEQVEVEVK